MTPPKHELEKIYDVQPHFPKPSFMFTMEKKAAVHMLENRTWRAGQMHTRRIIIARKNVSDTPEEEEGIGSSLCFWISQCEHYYSS